MRPFAAGLTLPPCVTSQIIWRKNFDVSRDRFDRYFHQPALSISDSI